MAEIFASNMAVTLDDLPVEILDNIINFLEAEDLLSALSVNKKWNAVASRSAEKRNVFVMRLNEMTLSESHPFVETFMKSNRNFQCCQFDNCEFKEGLLAFLRKFGPQLKELVIKSNIFHCQYDYLLRKCTKLEKLMIRSADHVEMDFLDNMPQLKVLYFFGVQESLDTIGTGRIKVFPNLKKFIFRNTTSPMYVTLDNLPGECCISRARI